MALDEGRPAGGEPGGQLGLRAVLGQRASFPAAERLGPDQAEQRGQQGHRGGHREQDGERGGDGDTVEEAQAQDQHAEQRHAHRAAREDHRPAGGGDGLLRGPGDAQAAFEPAAVPGDDEQRVVDADAEPDEHAEHRREVGDRHGVAEQHDAHVRGAAADERGRDGQQHRREGAEGDQQHHGRHRDAHDLAQVRAGALGVADRLAAQFDLEAGAPPGLRGVHQALGLGAADAVGGLGVVDGGVRGVPVAADLAGAGRAVRAGDGGDAGQGAGLVQHVRHGLLDVAGPYRAPVGVPDDGVGVARLPGERPLQQRRRVARTRCSGPRTAWSTWTPRPPRPRSARRGRRPTAGRR